MISTFLVVSALLIIQVYARCPGTCGDRSQCLASGKRYEKGLCNGGVENVCCMNSITCDGNGMCRGDQYCRGQGGNPITGKCPGPSEVQCCKGQSSSPNPVNPNPVNPNPVNPNPVNPNPVNPVNPSAPSGSQGTCSYNGANGHCLPTSSCGAGMSSVPSSRGAQGCGHIRSSSVQCCVASSAVPAAPSVPSGSSGSLTKCQVVALLREAGFAESQIPRMTCTAYYESTWRCGVVGPPNSNGSRDYGLFQANSVYWCSGGPGSNRGNGCSSSCEGLRDCRANVRCAKTILAQQGITAWYAYRSHRSECERYSISECGGAVAPPANPNPPVVVPPADPVTPQQPANIPCRYQGVDGSCKPTSQCQLTSVASRDGASGCGHIRDADTQCCVQTSQQAPVNPAQPATTEAPAEPSGSQGACSYAGNDGQCVPTQSCPSGRQSFPSSAGAMGCNHIRDSNVQCCVVPPPQGSVPSFNVPAGRSCALARPQGCSAFTGSTLTVNIKFVDEVIRSHSHARNAGVRIYVTSSFRTSSSRVGVSTSRHKVGFAYDMNPNSCNADCMCPYPNVRNRGAKNFLDRIVGDSTIHWGGDPSNPIRYTPTGSSCRHDTVHIQSRVYEDRPRYSSVRTCLNRENSAGRFQRFPCSSGASLLNDGLAPDPDLAEQGVEQDSDAMSAGAIAGIVIGVLLACIAVVCVAVFVATRSSKQESGEAITYSNEAYSLGQATPSAVGMDVIDMPDMVSARVDQADVLADAAFGVHSAGGSYAGTGYDEGTMLRRPTNGNQPTVTTGAYDEASEEAQAYAGYTGVGSYECDICGKKYDYAEDLAEHSALRH